MPIRQNVQGDINAPQVQGYQASPAARAQLQTTQLSAGPNFWDNLAASAGQGLEKVGAAYDAKAYLQGQQDSEMGKDRQDVHSFMQDAYTQGYNRAKVGTDLAQFQVGLNTKAVEFVNSGKSPEEWNQYVHEQTNNLLGQAGSQGMDLQSKDWQSWLNAVDSTRNTAADLYQTKSVERAQYMKGQALAAEGSAATATFVAADEAGNPLQAMDNISGHITRIYSDDTLSPQQKDGALASFATNVLTASRSSAAVDSMSSYFQNLKEFQALPTDTQTQIMQRAQAQYQQRATDESGQVYSYLSEMRALPTATEANAQYPMATVIARLNEAQKNRLITPAQMFGMVEEENTRRTKLMKAENVSNALMSGQTMSDISTQSGLTMGKVKQGLESAYATANGGYSGGGLALMQRGLSAGASDITAVGIGMLQQDASSLGSIDSRTLKKDADGNPVYPATVANSLTNLKTAYDTMVKAGNNVQAQQLVAGLPDAVAYGIRQNVDANSMASTVYRRADDIAAGRVAAMPATMDKSLLGTRDDVTAGLFDTNMTQKGAARNILGIQSYLFNSKADEAAMDARLLQFNQALSEEYTSLFNQGKLPLLSGDDLKKSLVGRVAARTVRVDDGTDNGSLLILPSVANKAQLFGSEDNNIIAQGLKDPIAAFHKANPGATTVQMRYDQVANELVLSGTDKNNTLLTTSQGIPVAEVASNVRSVEARLTQNGKGNTVGNLTVPNAGMLKFDTNNKFGVDPSVYGKAVNQLVSYEGYTDSKGFSILGVHPTTGAKLNDAEYVKQPGDSPQVAADKLSSYLQDKILPPVMTQMNKYSALPESLRQRIFGQLVDTTYHAGNANAFGQYIDQVLSGDTVGAYKGFRESALFKDAGGLDSRRNQDRMTTLDWISQYRSAQYNR